MKPVTEQDGDLCNVDVAEVIKWPLNVFSVTANSFTASVSKNQHNTYEVNYVDQKPCTRY